MGWISDLRALRDEFADGAQRYDALCFGVFWFGGDPGIHTEDSESVRYATTFLPQFGAKCWSCSQAVVAAGTGTKLVYAALIGGEKQATDRMSRLCDSLALEIGRRPRAGQGHCLFQSGDGASDDLSLWIPGPMSRRFTYVIRLRGGLADVPVASR